MSRRSTIAPNNIQDNLLCDCGCTMKFLAQRENASSVSDSSSGSSHTKSPMSSDMHASSDFKLRKASYILK
eukprot:CAMPEP_0170330402 /NCGR_PEP_ID=MMETSP0116_2-20130129/66134_1 /TAXON_ID=400756 /ORGANISM="Durinskia baltica, Strain CSIRO CS-38" /LENGTH=70 /DNA_ID=CAMNT_0010583571 /DNA_START=211 /DNA_END=423 /DNA_ORIENTATION=-